MEANRTKRTSENARERFLDCLAQTANVSAACAAAQVARRTVYEWREQDEEFARRWVEALDVAVDELELVARRRAAEESDTLMIFLLKAHRPDKYRERQEIRHGLADPLDGADQAALLEQLRARGIVVAE